MTQWQTGIYHYDFIYPLLVFNQSISDVIKYGFGMFLAAGAILLIGNLISLGLTLKMQSSRS